MKDLPKLKRYDVGTQIQALVSHYGSRRKFCKEFEIPERTLYDWISKGVPTKLAAVKIRELAESIGDSATA